MHTVKEGNEIQMSNDQNNLHNLVNRLRLESFYQFHNKLSQINKHTRIMNQFIENSFNYRGYCTAYPRQRIKL